MLLLSDQLFQRGSGQGRNKVICSQKQVHSSNELRVSLIYLCLSVYYKRDKLGGRFVPGPKCIYNNCCTIDNLEYELEITYFIQRIQSIYVCGVIKPVKFVPKTFIRGGGLGWGGLGISKKYTKALI